MRRTKKSAELNLRLYQPLVFQQNRFALANLKMGGGIVKTQFRLNPFPWFNLAINQPDRVSPDFSKYRAFRNGNFLHFQSLYFKLRCMTQPLALVLYEKLLPGSQLANRLVDLGYRVQTVTDASLLAMQAEAEKPLVAVIDLYSTKSDICECIRQLRQNESTQHIPVLAFTEKNDKKVVGQANAAGATLVAIDAAILSQLPRLLEQVLEVE